MASSFFALCIFLVVVVNYTLADELVVTLNHGGQVVGSVMKSQQGRTIYAFRGIPFAEPPIGENRFQPPIPKAAWHGPPLDATKDGAACIQIDPTSAKGPVLFGEEDCLFINVYTDKLPDHQASTFEKKAVLVWIHGGGFYFGEATSKMYGPGRIMDDPNIILVTMGYRLGALGFLGTNDAASPGNYGMMDQTLALKWVQDNIEAFGGDPKRVTIFGESAGGASVSFHLLSPMSAGLFQNAIAISGSALCPWAFKEDPMFWTKQLSDGLGCRTTETSEIVECLKKIPADHIVQKSMQLMTKGLMASVIFSPTIDGKFLLKSPKEIMTTGNLPSKVPLITGVNKDESITFYLGIQKSHPDADLTSEKVISRLISKMLDSTGKSLDVARIFVQKYLTTVDLSNADEMRDAVMKMMRHAMFEMPHYETVALRAKHGLPTYAYRLEYDPSVGFNEIMGSKLKGVAHADDLFLMFDGPLFGMLKPNDDDKKIIDVIHALWTNLAKHGDPTPNTSELLPIKWDLSIDGKLPVYHIDIPIKTTTFETSKEDLYQFWITTVDKALQSKKAPKKDEL